MNAVMRQKGSGFKPKFSQEVESGRCGTGLYRSERNEPFGMFEFCFCVGKIGPRLRVIISDGLGWDHVSVSLEDRCPTWAEMNLIKDMFFDPECCVVQFHPPQSVYVNNHVNVLHLWHKQGSTTELPPRECV